MMKKNLGLQLRKGAYFFKFFFKFYDKTVTIKTNFFIKHKSREPLLRKTTVYIKRHILLHVLLI